LIKEWQENDERSEWKKRYDKTAQPSSYACYQAFSSCDLKTEYYA
jgi:hypothetical protein